MHVFMGISSCVKNGYECLILSAVNLIQHACPVKQEMSREAQVESLGLRNTVPQLETALFPAGCESSVPSQSIAS